VNINAALGAIQEAMDSAELDAEGIEVETALVSFAGGGVEGINSRGVVAVSGKDGKNEIHPDDVKTGDRRCPSGGDPHGSGDPPCFAQRVYRG
jgi:cell division ATPase FtsA